MHQNADEIAKPRLHIRTSVRLTQPEHEVLERIAGGQGRKSVGRAMRIDRTQIQVHLDQVYRKLSVTNIAAAIGVAEAHGLLPHEPHGCGSGPEDFNTAVFTAACVERAARFRR